MSAYKSATMTEQYRPSRRAWVKLWTEETIHGTIRVQLSPAERSVWFDLLCLAGAGRHPGYVASGLIGGEDSGLLGHSREWIAGTLYIPLELLNMTLVKLVAQSRVTVTEVEARPGYMTIVIKILGWEKYQSEYMLKRQRRKYNEPRRADGDYNVHPKSTECPPQTPPEEVEVEVEVEVNTKALNHSAKDARVSAQFEEFWKRYPRHADKKRAFTAWRNLSQADRDLAVSSLDKWLECRQWRSEGGRYVPYAQKFLNRELFKEDPRASAAPDDFNERFNRAAAKR